MRIPVQRLMLAAASLSISLGAVFASVGVASATASSNTEVVVVVRDITSSAHCRQGHIFNVGKATQTASSASCLAGTVVGTFHVPLSEALHNHEAYVTLPAASAPQAVLTDAYIAIQNLIASVQIKPFVGVCRRCMQAA